MTKYSRIHILLALITFWFCTQLRGQNIDIDPILLQSSFDNPKPEIMAYQLVPGKDNYCHFEIQIIEAFAWNNIPKAQRFETEEIVIDRIVFEATNPWAINEMFYIDEKPYFLVRVPFQGYEW